MKRSDCFINSLKYALVSTILLGGPLYSGNAQAGFQWVEPPPPTQPVVIGGGLASQPIVPQVYVPEPPMVIGTDAVGTPYPPAPAQYAAGQMQPPSGMPMSIVPQQQELPPVVPVSQNLNPVAQPQLQPAQGGVDNGANGWYAPPSPPSAPVYGNDGENFALRQPENRVLQGFANDVPLELALKQIVPPSYSFRAAPGVDMNALVSWHGGQGWRETLQAVLVSQNLAVYEQGSSLMIVQAAAQPAPAPMGEPAPLAYMPDSNVPSSVVPSQPVMPAPQDQASLAVSAPQNMADIPLAAPAQGGVVGGEAYNLAGPDLMLGQPSVVSPDQYGASLNAAPQEEWRADKGETLKKVLEEWSERSGVQLAWQAEYDYPLQASVKYTGSFEDAVRSILVAFQEAQPQPIASLHKTGDDAQTVLVVQVRGNNFSD